MHADVFTSFLILPFKLLTQLSLLLLAVPNIISESRTSGFSAHSEIPATSHLFPFFSLSSSDFHYKFIVQSPLLLWKALSSSPSWAISPTIRFSISDLSLADFGKHKTLWSAPVISRALSKYQLSCSECWPSISFFMHQNRLSCTSNVHLLPIYLLIFAPLRFTSFVQS